MPPWHGAQQLHSKLAANTRRLPWRAAAPAHLEALGVAVQPLQRRAAHVAEAGALLQQPG